MVRLFNYLIEDWSTKRWYERFLPVVLATSIGVQAVNMATSDSSTTVAISAICFYLNSIVLLSTMLNPVRYMSPTASLLNTYGVVTGYLPFRKRQDKLINDLCRLIKAAGFAPELGMRKRYLGFPLDLLRMQIEFIVLSERTKRELAKIAPV